MNKLKVKGRSSHLIERRNYKLAARFYFYNCLIGLKMERCLELLKPEFDLAKSTLYSRVLEMSDVIGALEKEDITVVQLSKWYPYLNWSLRYTSSSQIFEQWFSDLPE